MAKLKLTLTILAAVLLGSATVGTAPATSSPTALVSLAGQAGNAPAGSDLGSSAGSPSGNNTSAPPLANRPARVPPACPPALGSSPVSVSLCHQPCPVVVDNPTGLCPPIAPPAGAHPVIAFCPQPPVVLRPVPGPIELHGFLCGRGFHGSETVTITATGLHGTYSWKVTASPAGSFVTPLPSFLCRLAPLTLVARGSTGDRSNWLSLSASCLVML